MNGRSLNKTLSKLNISGLRYFDTIGSTNDEALAWAADGAADVSLVVADEQTQGRGRLDRTWFTSKGTALAFSLILRPPAALRPHLSRTVGLAALSITDALLKMGLVPCIKWPNDILLGGRKTAGILVETVWAGEDVDSLVIGMGVNILRASTPPAELLKFPATSIEAELGRSPDRELLLRDILLALIAWYPRLGADELIHAWDERLSFRGEQVQVREGNGEFIQGELLGIESDGSLRLRNERDNFVIVRFGDVSLRPLA